MIEIDVRTNIREVTKYLTSIEKEQIPFAAKTALNFCVENAQADIVGSMDTVFDRPTPFTKGALRVKYATKKNLTAEVKIKDESLKSDAPIKWLAPQIYGGARPFKRFERLLQGRGILPLGLYAVPGSGARLDAYGNMSRGQINQILSALGSQRDYQANRRGKRGNRGKRRGGDFFAVRQQSGRLKPGIYERISFGFGSSVRPVIVFARTPTYSKRLPFFQVVNATIEREFSRQFALAMNAALQTANLRISEAA